MRALAVGLVLLFGCDQIFGISDPSADGGHAVDAKQADGRQVDARQIDATGGPDAPPAVPAFVGSDTVQVAGGSMLTTHVQSLAAPIGAGHLVVVVLSIYTSGVDVDSISDSSNNSYVAAGSIATEGGSGTGGCETWFAANTNPVPMSGEINVGLTATSEFGIWVAEFSGVALADPLDQFATVSNGSSVGSDDTIVGAAVVTMVSNELLVAMSKVQRTLMSPPSGGFTDLRNNNGDDAGFEVASTPGSYQATWSSNPAGSYCANTVAFKPGTL